MKKILFAFIALALLLVCAVSASASEVSLEKMEITKLPDQVTYTPEDAVERTESVWVEATQSVSAVTYSYYPVDFSGMEITFTYSDQTTDVFKFDEVLSLVSEKYTIKNETVQNAQNQWAAGKIYTITLSCESLTDDYQVTVTDVVAQSELTGFSIESLPDKTIYLEADGMPATAFDENGDTKQYKVYDVDTYGLLLKLSFRDGSVAYCTQAMLPVLTGETLIVESEQTYDNAWDFGENEVKLQLGGFTQSFKVYLDVENHKIDSYTWLENDTHKGTCAYCQQTFTGDCTGGEATCSAKAVCEICKHAYGESLPHTLTYTQTQTGHTASCSVCDFEQTDLPHNYTAGAFDAEKKHIPYTCENCAYVVNGLPLGDVNEDGTISAADAREALRASVALTTLNLQQARLADVNADGSISATDARAILRASVGLERIEAILPVPVQESEE